MDRNTKLGMSKYFMKKTYISYYYRNGKMKGIILKLVNRVLRLLLMLRHFRKSLLKGISKLGKILNIKDSQLKKSVLGQLYINQKYKMNMHNHPRKYIPLYLGIEGFFEQLYKRKVNYVILRWFEDLPKWPDGEDIDILIEDADIHKISDLFSTVPKGIPIDTYTRAGSNGCSYSIAGPYFPPIFGDSILKNKVLYKDKYYVPNTEYHFLSMVYHITYHKAEESGLWIDQCRRAVYEEKDHDYLQYLKCFSQLSNIDGEMNLYNLHGYLSSRNLCPRLDTLRKLYMIKRSHFLYELASNYIKTDIQPYDMIVYIIREWAIEKGILPEIIDAFIENNLEIVSYCYLSEEEKKRAASFIRGGDWGKGPYPVSGGLPQLMIVVFDYHPKRQTSQDYPFVVNENVLIKHKIRDLMNNRLLATKWVNFIHSSDDYTEAREYIEIIRPEIMKTVMSKIHQMSSAYDTHQKVIKQFHSYNTRSKIEIIEYNGRLAVKKTFKKGRECFLQREIYAYKELSNKIPYIPKLLDFGENYIIIPFFDNLLKNKTPGQKRKIIKKFKKEIYEFMTLLYKEGYAVIDFNINNVIITEDNCIYIIDFEFLYKYPVRPKSFEVSYDIAGIPNNFEGDLPKGLIPPGHTYKTWRKLVGSLVKQGG